jgi:uncharacterized membrane protein YiaA
MTGNNPRNYYIAAIFFLLFAVFLAWRTWVSYSADDSTVAAMLLFCTILCIVEVLLLMRNGKRRAKGIPPRRGNRL